MSRPEDLKAYDVREIDRVVTRERILAFLGEAPIISPMLLAMYFMISHRQSLYVMERLEALGDVVRPRKNLVIETRFVVENPKHIEHIESLINLKIEKPTLIV